MDTLSAAGLLIGVLLVVAHMLYGVQGGRPLRFSEAVVVFLAGNGFIAGIRLIFYSVYAFLLDPSSGMGIEGLAIIMGGIALSWVSILAIIEIYKQRFGGENVETEEADIVKARPRAALVREARNEPPARIGSRTFFQVLAALALIAAIILIVLLARLHDSTRSAPVPSTTPSMVMPDGGPAPQRPTPGVTIVPDGYGPPITSQEEAIAFGKEYLSTTRLSPVGTPVPVFAEEMRPQDLHYVIGDIGYDLPPYPSPVWLVIFKGDWLVIPPVITPLMETAAPRHGCVYTIFAPTYGGGASVGQCQCPPPHL